MSILGNTNNNILTVAYHCAEQIFPISDSDQWQLPASLSNLNRIYVEATCIDGDIQFVTRFSVQSGETYIIQDPDIFGSSSIDFYFQRDRPDQHGYIEWRELGGGSHQFEVVVSNVPYYHIDHRNIDLVIQQNDTWPTFPYTFDSDKQGYGIDFAQNGQSSLLQSNYWLPLRLHALANGSSSQIDKYLYWDFDTGAYGTAAEQRVFTINNAYGQLTLQPEANFWPAGTSKKLYGDMWVAICPHVSAAPGQLLLLGQDALTSADQSQLYTIQRNYKFNDDNNAVTCMSESVYVNDREANVGFNFSKANKTSHGFNAAGYGSAVTQSTPTQNGFAAPAPVWGGKAKKSVLATPYNWFLIDKQSGYMLETATTSTVAAYLKANNMCPMYIHASSDGFGKVLWKMPTTTSGAQNPLVVDTNLTVYTYCTKDAVVGINNQLYMLFAYKDSNNINSFVSTAPMLRNALCSAINYYVDEFSINGYHYSVARSNYSPQTWNAQINASTPYSLTGYGISIEVAHGGDHDGKVIINGHPLLTDTREYVLPTDTIVPNGSYLY